MQLQQQKHFISIFVSDNSDRTFLNPGRHPLENFQSKSWSHTGWQPPKSLDSGENFKPELTLFCRELRFVAIYALFFGDLWAKKVPFWVKTVLLGQEVH